MGDLRRGGRGGACKQSVPQRLKQHCKQNSCGTGKPVRLTNSAIASCEQCAARWLLVCRGGCWRGLGKRPGEEYASAGCHHVLATVEFIGNRRIIYPGACACVPEGSAVARVQCEEVAVGIAGEG